MKSCETTFRSAGGRADDPWSSPRACDTSGRRMRGSALSVDSSRREQRAGFALFLAVTAFWTLWCTLGLVAWDDMPAAVSPADVGSVIAAIPSALSVVVT